MCRRLSLLLLACVFVIPLTAQRKKKQDSTAETKTEEKKSKFNSATFSGLKLRSIGPALTSGRISDFAVNPDNPYEYYVAVASGGVWKTINSGTTYQPIFDGQSSYSIGCITLDPSNPHIVWVGSGENNGQRSVAYGDGVYKSTDGGKSWKNMGLKESEHIGKIIVDPRDSDVIFVAAQGPLWNEGGDRGLYKSTDGGETWNNVLEISEHTGVSDVVIDPRNPDVMYATSWQRRRHVWTFISGGPESTIYKSTDGGETWNKAAKGLPGGDLGRIGLAISPVNPDIVYAIVEAGSGKGGFYRSSDRGGSWQKRSGYSTSGNYYQEIICDPIDVDRVYSMNTWAQVTNDGGKSWGRLGEKHKHVDNHALWIDPDRPNYYLIGCDGGIYESFDRAKTWHFKENLPITQFYKVATDNAEPFYHVYGGTQDNFSMGGPSRTTNTAGIVNADWYITNGGDGFESQVDPTDANIVYAQAQYGFLVRHDKKSGEGLFIQPQPGKGEAAYRWNWDAPLVLSKHNSNTLYFAANKVFKSTDRGDSWTTISGDLSRQIDRNTLPVMGKVWSMDAVAKNASTSIYGNIVAMDESPLQQGLLYVGTDDGLIHISGNDGGDWRKIESVSGVPERTYVNMLLASQHDANTVYAAFNNHKNGDFQPYVYKSTDKGQTWQSITADLPDRGSVYAIAEDHVDPNLLFVGTEFGLFFSANGGGKWVQLKAGLPTIAVRDLDIQRRENDLVLATFGRGFYVLDDYSPLRNLNEESLEKDAHIFAIKDAWMYHPSAPLGLGGKSFQGESYYTAKNPPVASVITYYLGESIQTLKQKRQKEEKKLAKDGKDISYPSFDEMRAEDNEEKPYLLFTISDEDGNVVRRLKAPARKGVHRINWDFRYPASTPINLRPSGPENPFAQDDAGHMAAPGTYYVSMSKVENGIPTEMVSKQAFNIKPLNNATIKAEDHEAVLAFQKKVSELQRAVTGANQILRETSNQMRHIKEAIRNTPAAPTSLMTDARNVENQIQSIRLKLQGDRSVARRQFETPPSINGRISFVVYGLWDVSSAPNATHQKQFEIATEEFAPLMDEIKAMRTRVAKLEKQLESHGAPYTPGRMPSWQKP